jgi:hypothetical protein
LTSLAPTKRSDREAGTGWMLSNTCHRLASRTNEDGLAKYSLTNNTNKNVEWTVGSHTAVVLMKTSSVESKATRKWQYFAERLV